jgi:hypothetical protein
MPLFVGMLRGQLCRSRQDGTGHARRRCKVDHARVRARRIGQRAARVWDLCDVK